MLLSAVVALDISCLILFLELKAEETECSVAARHNLRQVNVHIVLDVAILTLTAHTSGNICRSARQATVLISLPI